MRAYWTLVKRELGSFFYSWTGYTVMAGVAFLLGVSFVHIIAELNNRATERPVTEVFYITAYFWWILVLATPLITMRSFAQEKALGTFETLMTTPVKDVQVMLAKFSGALLFYMISWLPLLGCLWMLRYYSNDPELLDGGALAATYFGILMLGALYVSMGCLASALTRSQIIAAIVSLSMGFSLWVVSLFAHGYAGEAEGWRARVLEHLGLTLHMQDMSAGVIDTRPVLLCLSLTVFFLFLTLKVIESRRWK